MDLPAKRVRKIVEIVIDTAGDGVDAKDFGFQYNHAMQMMRDDGVDMSFDDAFKVRANEGEVVFVYEKEK